MTLRYLCAFAVLKIARRAAADRALGSTLNDFNELPEFIEFAQSLDVPTMYA